MLQKLQKLSPQYFKLVKNINELTKFKLSVLNGIVTIASYSLYSTPYSCLPLFASSILLSMSTQALNQYIEIEHDKKMLRTSQRPLVKGFIEPENALKLGAGLGLLGMAGLSTYNPLTAMLGASIWGGYLLVYTRMKRTTEWNTFVGSLVGSLPVYLGWVASGRNICMVQPFAIFIYMMAWQHQHFYGIRWIYYDDYNNAGFKMEKNKRIASALTICQTILSMVLVNYAIRYYDISNCYLLNIPLTLGLYRWGITPSLQFSEGKITPKELKMQSYKHFTLVFGIFLFCSIIGNNKDENINIRERNLIKSPDLTHLIYL